MITKPANSKTDYIYYYYEVLKNKINPASGGDDPVFHNGSYENTYQLITMIMVV